MGIAMIFLFALMLIIIGMILILYSIFSRLKNKKFLKTMVPGCIFGVTGIILIIFFAGFLEIDTDYYLSIHILDETPPYFFNMSEQQVEKLPYLKEGMLKGHFGRGEISEEEFWEIHDFFEDNNYEHLGMHIYVKYQNSFYEIELSHTE